MLPRQVNLDKIQKYLISIESDIQANNYCRFYDINIISETFCCNLLNLAFNLKLENSNLFKKNQKAIDLVDKENGIAIQITSEKNIRKIKETFEQYIDDGLDKVYPKMYIITLVKYDPSIEEYCYNGNTFNIKDNVLDYRDFLNILSNKYDNDKFLKIKRFLEKELEISNNKEVDQYVEECSFDTERGIRDAIVGNRLYPYNVKSCPELPVIESIQKTLDYQYYCVISGESGCGKSISAYQIGYKYYQNGWKVYRFLNNNKFDYTIFSKFDNKTVLIIDDAQTLENFKIERIISCVNENVRIIITITDAIALQDDSVKYITNEDSIKKLTKEYLSRKKELYPILKELDNDIDDKYMKDTIEKRIEVASKQKTPWLFNFALRGGWNKAISDFMRVKNRNATHKLLVILSFLQLLYLDKTVSKLELIKNCEIWNEDYDWFNSNMQYLVENKIIIEEYGKYRCAHIRYADFFIQVFINNCNKEELGIILNFLRSLIIDENYSLQGISWVLNSLGFEGKSYYITNNLIRDEELEKIIKRCFSSDESLNVRNALFVLDEIDRYSKKMSDILSKEKYLKKIAYWIENVDKNTGYALGRIINDYFINKHLNKTLLLSYINKKIFLKSINKCEYKAIGPISSLLDRLMYLTRKNKKDEIVSKIDIDVLAKKINEKFYDMYLEEILDIIGVINLYNEDNAMDLYKKTKKSIAYFFEKDALKAYESMDDKFIWAFLGYSHFSDKKPKEKYRNIAKELLGFINIEKLAIQISNTNLHDMERYARFLGWINIVDIDVTKKIVNLLDFDIIDENMKEYLKIPPSELSLFIYFIGKTNEKKFIDWMEKNIQKIKLAQPLISIVYPKLVANCIIQSNEIDIFGHNNSFEAALEMIISLNEYDREVCLNVLEISVDRIANRLSNLHYVIDFSKEEMTYHFINCIKINYPSIFDEIINSLNIQEVKQNLKENYYRIINSKCKYDKKMLCEFKKIVSFYKKNPVLNEFCDDLIFQ